MLKGKLAVVCLLVVASLIVVNSTANAGIIDPCRSYWQLHASVTPCPYFACPAGDTPSFLAFGWWVQICVLDVDGLGIENVPPGDLWFLDCDPLADLNLCGVSASSFADSLTNAAGMTSMSNGSLSAGGCVDGLALVIQGFTVLDSATTCTSDFCCPIWVRSPDITGDLLVDLSDLALFGICFAAATVPPADPCCDFNLDNLIDLSDLALFAFHFGPPGHFCT
jgi:hypothetical protein